MARTSGKKPPPSLAQDVRVERSESTRGIRRSEATLTWWKCRRKGVLEKERGWQNTHPCTSDVRWKSSQDEKWTENQALRRQTHRRVPDQPFERVLSHCDFLTKFVGVSTTDLHSQASACVRSFVSHLCVFFLSYRWVRVLLPTVGCASVVSCSIHPGGWPGRSLPFIDRVMDKNASPRSLLHHVRFWIGITVGGRVDGSSLVPLAFPPFVL